MMQSAAVLLLLSNNSDDDDDDRLIKEKRIRDNLTPGHLHVHTPVMNFKKKRLTRLVLCDNFEG